MQRWLVTVFVCVAAAAAPQLSWGACSPPTCNKIIDNGPDSSKRVLVAMGDGFASADQTEWRNIVDTMLVNGVFGNDFFREQQNAFNLYRLDLVSAESGISTRVYDEKGTPGNGADDTITSTTMKNTALKIIYSGSWAHCWLEYSGETEAKIQAALSANVPNAELVVIVLNTPGGAGCGGGGRQHVSKGVSWQVMAHEFGHGTGGLWDEYTGPGLGSTAYSGAATNNRNCSTTNNRSSVFWNRFIDPATPVPTTLGAGMDSNRTVGEFEGCGTVGKGIYRPVHNCRMNGNTPNFCPVCQTLMRGEQYADLGHDFDVAYSGDFNGDGRDDVLVKNGNDLAIYRSSGPPHRLDRVWTANNVVPSAAGSGYTWKMSTGDSLKVGDFDGDGKDDVIVFNGSTWGEGPYLGLWKSDGTGLGVVRWYLNSLPGWTMKPGDRVHLGDFDGDNKDDVVIFNGSNWSIPYLVLLKSTGTGLSYSKRYDQFLPGWEMKNGDRFHLGDLDGDAKQDVYVFNGSNWSYPYLLMLKSTGTEYSYVKRFDQSLPGWQMTPGDRFYVADFDGDQKRDLYVFNGANWCCAYLLMAKSTGADLAFVKRYDDGDGDVRNIPGWQMRKGDLFYVSDSNKDGKGDLFVFNKKTNWSTEYLGTLRSTATALSGSWSEDWVTGIPGQGGWNLGGVDTIIPANYEGGTGKADIFIRNTHWLGLLRRGSGGFVMDRHYHDWIHTPLFDSKPWATTMP